MGETEVAIGESELNLIGEYVRGNLKEWLREVGPFGGQQDLVTTAQFQVGMGRLDERYVQTQERLIRVEEELKAGREVMVARFEASDRRFESIDLRIGDLIKTMDDRFAGVKENIGTVKWFIVTGFLVLGAAISLLAVFQ